MSAAANDNQPHLFSSIDLAVAGQAITLKSHRRFGHGKHVYVRKLISSMYRGRWTKPMKIERALISAVHTNMAQAA